MSRLSSCFCVKIAYGKKICLFAVSFLFHFYLLKTTEVALPKNRPSQLPGDEGKEVLREWPLWSPAMLGWAGKSLSPYCSGDTALLRQARCLQSRVPHLPSIRGLLDQVLQCHLTPGAVSLLQPPDTSELGGNMLLLRPLSPKVIPTYP